MLAPARKSIAFSIRHFAENLGIGVISSLFLRLAPGLLAAQLALMAETKSIGLFNTLGAGLDPVFVVVACVVLLDLAIYWQHRLFHVHPYLWRLHRVHHSDKRLEASSALRFHPIEIGASMLFKSLLVLIFGIPFVAVVVFEIALNAFAIFNHANFRFEQSADRKVRKLVVTPSMHRVHHSTDITDSNSNFGFCLSCWDRMFGTYRDNSITHKKEYEMGVEGLNQERSSGLVKLLIQPFSK